MKKRSLLIQLTPGIILMALIWAFLSFGTMLSPKEETATHQAFVTALTETTIAMDTVPSPRVVSFENGWGYGTFRIVTVEDYSVSKTERCATYHYAFTDTQRKECISVTFRDHKQDIVEQ